MTDTKMQDAIDFLNELAGNAADKRKALNPILVGQTARKHALNLQLVLVTAKPLPGSLWESERRLLSSVLRTIWNYAAPRKTRTFREIANLVYETEAIMKFNVDS